jgi:hypothetical protein
MERKPPPVSNLMRVRKLNVPKGSVARRNVAQMVQSIRELSQ